MLSGTVEPECCNRRPVILLTAAVAMSGADAAIPAPRVISAWTDDAPHVRATKFVTRANIHTTVNGVARTEVPGRLDRGELEGLASDGFRKLSAGGQLGPHVRGRGVRADALRRRGLGRAGRRTALHSKLVSVSGVRVDRRTVARSGIGVDECRCGHLHGVAARHGHPGRGDGCAGQVRSRRLPDRVYSTVPPQSVAANRSQLANLVSTNIFGRNTQAIAATEAQYGEMWAQDAAAMYGYAALVVGGDDADAVQPTEENTNPSGAAGQSAAASQATGTAAGNAQSTIQQAFSAMPSALQSAARRRHNGRSRDPLGTISDLISIFVDLPADLADFHRRMPLGSLGVVVPSLRHQRLHHRCPHRRHRQRLGWRTGLAGGGDRLRSSHSRRTLQNLRPGTYPRRASLPESAEANTIGALSVPPKLDRGHPGGSPRRDDAARAAAGRAHCRRGSGFGQHAQRDGVGRHGRQSHGRNRRHRRQPRRRQRFRARWTRALSRDETSTKTSPKNKNRRASHEPWSPVSPLSCATSPSSVTREF